MGTFLFMIQFSPRLLTWIQEREVGRLFPLLWGAYWGKYSGYHPPTWSIHQRYRDGHRQSGPASPGDWGRTQQLPWRNALRTCLRAIPSVTLGTFLPTLRSPWHRPHNILHSMQVLVAGDEGGHSELCLCLLGLCSRSITTPPHPSQTLITHST